MKFTAFASSLFLLGAIDGSSAFSVVGNQARAGTALGSAVDSKVEGASKSDSATKDPLLIRAARGEKVERTPVWMMRQAGRHIKEYRDLCKEYPTFRMRSEIPEVAVEVSLQPWRNYQTDGCILFSDILTPFPGMGLDFNIDEKLGPVMDPVRTWDAFKERVSFRLSECNRMQIQLSKKKQYIDKVSFFLYRCMLSILLLLLPSSPRH